MNKPEQFALEHAALTRRYFLQLGTGGLAALASPQTWAAQSLSQVAADPLLADAVRKLEYLTPLSKFKFTGRGTPPIQDINPDKLPAAGLTRETWKLEIKPDPESNSDLRNPLAKEKGNALDFPGLIRIAEKSAVRFLHVLTCTNVPMPFGMGLWEGVPLREVIWMTKPGQNIRRIFFYGYHNDDPQQRFQASLPISRVMSEAPGELPVILCYKMNGQWLSQAGGGPVRLVAPGFYGNRSIKWLQCILATNKFHANDTYAEANNDVECPLKTVARFINAPKKIKTGQPFALTGMAQVGISGLTKVQFWIRNTAEAMPANDPYLTRGDWRDAIILPPPENWGNDLPDGKLPPVMQMNAETGKPFTWPIPNTIVHWAAFAKADKPGKYELRCRSVDANNIAQPLPLPFGRSGQNAISVVEMEAGA